MKRMEQYSQIEEEARSLDKLQAKAMGIFLYDGGNYSVSMESSAACEAARISAAYATMLRETHPPKVKSLRTARARLIDLIQEDDNHRISPALIVIDCKDLAKFDVDGGPWIAKVVDKVIEYFATLYKIKTPKRKDPLDGSEARIVLAQMKQQENVKFQTAIFTNVDNLSQDQQLALCNVFLGKVADTRSLNAFLIHEKEITHMSPGKDGAPPLAESRWHFIDLSGEKTEVPEWLASNNN